MSSTELSRAAETMRSAASTIPLRLEVVVIPVGDVDRALSFYEGLGWRLDADVAGEGGYRLVQLTPPASNTSIVFGSGVSSDEPGSIESLVLSVDDIEAACQELRVRGADVSEVFHDAGGSLGAGFKPGEIGRAVGSDPEGHSYASYASFHDPDGNRWLLQEITERLPGRMW